jgi:hypothetical protein
MARAIPAGQLAVSLGYEDSLLQERRHPTSVELDAISPSVRKTSDSAPLTQSCVCGTTAMRSAIDPGDCLILWFA